jgi:hypothetical protein
MRFTIVNKALATASLFFLSLATAAHSGPTDTALPAFSDGKSALHVYTAVGVVKNNRLETVFVCSNFGDSAVNIGLEIFDKTGVPVSSIPADEGVSLDVPVGATTTIATGATALLTEDVVLMALPTIANGSARIVASAKSVSCTAWLLDDIHEIVDPAVSTLPPPTGLSLPLISVP